MKKQLFNHSCLIGKSFSLFMLTLSIDFFTFSYNKANAQIFPDNTWGSESTIFNSNIIDGGAKRGGNLFHSFQDFNVLENQDVYFRNPQGIINIISRVTGGNPSNILGKLGVQGDANLFIVNPQGILFGPNASLDVKGSFLATTANAVQFGNQLFFDTTSLNAPPLLNINPSGFLFTRTNVAPISDYSSSQINETRISNNPAFSPPFASPIINLKGLKVPDQYSLVLLGGEVTIDNGGLYALGGQIDIGSVADKGLVGLSFENNKLELDFPNTLGRGNIFFLNGSRIDASGRGSGGGSIHVTGKNIKLSNGSRIVSETAGSQHGKTLSFDATDSLELIGFSRGGVISTLTSSSGKGGNIKINTGNFFLRNGARISSITVNDGDGGDFDLTASGVIELDGLSRSSGIFSNTFSSGNGGSIDVKTQGSLFLRNAVLSAGGGVLTLNGQSIAATGNSGNISITVGNTIELDNNSQINAINPVGNAGDISLDARLVSIQNGSFITVKAIQGLAGKLEIKADSLTLNDGLLDADTGVSGANISLTILDTVRLENESKITATASGNADGGNITINTPILLALPPTGSEGSDIKATAVSGTGGNITINAQGIFGIQQRKVDPGNQTNDIDASSQFGQSGQVQINTTTDPNQGLIELPTTVIDPTTLVAQNPCRRASSSEFTRSGRGGLPPSLSQDLNSESTQVGLVEPTNLSAATPEPKSASKEISPLPPSSAQIVPAQGWVYNAKGEVVLVAYNSAVTGPQRLQSTPAGCPVF